MLKTSSARTEQVIRLRLNPEKTSEVVRMLDETGISRPVELYNNALTLLKWAIDQRKRGYEIASYEDRTEKFRIVTMPILDSVRPDD